MKRIGNVSGKTLNNWILDIGLILTSLVAIVSGVYFLYLPDGGFMGGRNPYYGIKILFERSTWEWLHTWISLGMVLIAAIHLIVHWKWVVNTTKRIVSSIIHRNTSWNRASLRSTIVNGLLGLSFIICSLTGVYLLLVPETKGSLLTDPMILFSRGTWDMLHTWSGVAFILAVLIHLVIHWGWVAKVTRKLFRKQDVTSIQPVASQI